MTERKAPQIFRIQTEADLDRIPFTDGMAAVEVPVHLLDRIELKNFERGESPRLAALERSIRARGYRPLEPITARIGRKGRWVVVNGGHRITAAKHVSREFWANLFRPKVEHLYFVLFTDPDSWRDVDPPPGVGPLTDRDGSDASREAWERARRRMRGVAGAEGRAAP
jgi:hypothetical protein